LAFDGVSILVYVPDSRIPSPAICTLLKASGNEVSIALVEPQRCYAEGSEFRFLAHIVQEYVQVAITVQVSQIGSAVKCASVIHCQPQDVEGKYRQQEKGKNPG
jgi:hypothetical protein